MKQFAQRLFSVYLVLYCLPFPLGSLPGTDSLQERYNNFLKWIAAWIGEHVIGLGPVFTGPTGSGDAPVNYILVPVFLVLAAIVALLWTAFVDRRNEERLNLLVFHYVRLTLASALFVYGWAKVIPPGQFGFVTPGRLLESYGDSSPMGLLWTLMGTSRPYALFSGVAEVTAGVLLFVPRFVTIGALLSAGVMANVFLLNMCYDVPVKLYSFHLLVLSVFLLAPDMRRLFRFFVLHLHVEPKTFTRLFHQPKWAKAAMFVQIIFPLVVCYASIQGTLEVGELYHSMVSKIKFFGVWKVKKFSLNSKNEPLAHRWARVAFDFRQRLLVRTTDGDWIRFQMEYDDKKNKMTMKEIDGSTSPSELTFEEPEKGHLVLNGKLNTQKVSMQLEQEANLEFPLLTRGFHWTNEYPYNR